MTSDGPPHSARRLPTGIVSLLFTDIEGSTKLLHELGPERYAEVLGEHRRVVREVIVAHGGVEVDTQGDSFFVAFSTAPGAVKDNADPVWLFRLGDRRFPPLRTISNTNLPRPATPLIGRDQDLARITGLLSDGARLVTLTGPGGTGKTRLALEAGASLVPAFANGVFWVDLAPLREASLVPATIAHTIGASDGLVEHVGDGNMLLLLDNFEQVVDAAPDIAALVETCSHLRILVTSRERLRVRGEVEHAVSPLAAAEAVELFHARSGVTTVEDEAAIAELCRRLDNLPLAIELAAARASVLSPRQILERLSGQLDSLKGPRDADPRQRTLRFHDRLELRPADPVRANPVRPAIGISGWLDAGVGGTGRRRRPGRPPVAGGQEPRASVGRAARDARDDPRSSRGSGCRSPVRHRPSGGDTRTRSWAWPGQFRATPRFYGNGSTRSRRSMTTSAPRWNGCTSSGRPSWPSS